MKPRFESPDGGDTDSDAIRSEIARTREKMDRTLDEIGDRMTPRHLLDDFLDFFRSHRPNRGAVKEKASAAMNRTGDAAGQVTHAIADVIRQHPIPTLLIGAGIAWAFYERRRQTWEEDYPAGIEEFGEGGYEMTQESSGGVESPGQLTGAKEKLAAGVESAKEKIQGKLSAAGERLQEKHAMIRERAAQGGRVVRAKASEWKQRMAEGAHHGYDVGREKFVRTSEEHPLSTGLGFLALGVLAGLALPRTRKEDGWLGEKADHLKEQMREKGQDFVERGKRVASAAAGAAKEVAVEQGLTPEALKEKVQRVASETRTAGERAAEEQGLKKPQTQPVAEDARI